MKRSNLFGLLALAACAATPALAQPPDQSARGGLFHQDTISLSFQDEDAAVILSLISEQGNAPMILRGHVTAHIRFIKLQDVTPAEAMQHVAEAAGLPWRKLDNGTYVIFKDAASATREKVEDKTAEDRVQSLILIHNVPVSLMAYWLDPQHHPNPNANASQSLPAPPASKLKTSGVFALPAGIDRLIEVKTPNALHVIGTPDGIEKLKQIVSYLDKPLRQVEIETQFFEVGADDENALAELGVQFPSPLPSGDVAAGAPRLAMSIVHNNWREKLEGLRAQGRAKLLESPRAMAINNLRAKMGTTSEVPITVNVPIGDAPRSAGSLTLNLSLITHRGLDVTPTINNDHTITLELTSLISQELASVAAPTSGAGNEMQAMNATANVRDGDTLALRGWRTVTITQNGIPIQVLSSLLKSGTKFPGQNAAASQRELIVFITPRIIHRVEDKQPAPDAKI